MSAEIVIFPTTIWHDATPRRSGGSSKSSPPRPRTSPSSTTRSSEISLHNNLDRLLSIEPSARAVLERFVGSLLEKRLPKKSRGADTATARESAHEDVDMKRQNVLAWHQEVPVAGWNTATALANPRTPAVPASLDLTLEEYFAAAALVGILGAQHKEPDMAWASKWASEMGVVMAAEARKRRKKR
jgi:hypothetical protein